ncbi:hypothetical protein [uncultured Methanomethylovorans sp.]|uniref:hypothetical protein n=1 Tax=uncultured Methanomethylovorans sp. TaxID=183759 RepID=UPI003749D2FF
MASWTQDGSGNWKKSESTKKNYTVIDGKKVEKVEETRSPSATSSDTWNKDKVTLEEAKQQTSDVEAGVINVNKGTTSIQTASTTETISLDQAKQQTKTEASNRVTAAETAQASKTPTEVSKQVTTVTNVYSDGNYAVTEETVTESKYNNLATIKAGSSVRSAAQLDPVTKTETESKIVETGSLKDRFSDRYYIADPINYSELKVPESNTTANKFYLSDAAMNAFSEQEISASELSSSSTTTKPFALEEKFNNPQAINTENIINASANAYNSVTATIGRTVVAPAAKIADKAIEYADTNIESADNKDYSKYEAAPLYGESESVLKEAPTQTIANATSNAAGKTAGYYVDAVSEVKQAAKDTLDAGNVFQVMDEGSGPNYQVNEKKASDTAAAKFVLSAGETIAVAPVAIPQAAIAFVKNPVSSTKDFVVNTGEPIIADPATGLGAVAGMVLTGRVIEGTVKVGKGATGKIGEFATDLKNSKTYERQAAALNDFHTVPKSVGSMPDVEPSVSKLSLVDVGYVKSAESFKLKNPKTADVVASKTMVKQNVIAKVETPESAMNYAENIAKLNEFKPVPESVKSMPNVEPVASRLGLVDIGKIKTTDSFKLRNASNKSILKKVALDNDTFNIKRQLKNNQNTIAKVETPESAVNYAENMAKLNEFKSNSYRSDYTGDFFERVENPNKLRAIDTKVSVREWDLDERVPKVKTSAPEVLKNFEINDNIGIDTRAAKRKWAERDTIANSPTSTPEVLQSIDKTIMGDNIGVDTKNRFKPDRPPTPQTSIPEVLNNFEINENVGIDTRFKTREWVKGEKNTTRRKAQKVNPDSVLKSTFADEVLQKDYFLKKNMAKFIEDDRGTVSFIEDPKIANKLTNSDIQVQRDSFTKEFNTPVEEAVQRPKRSEIERFTNEIREKPIERTKRSELIGSIGKQISSRGKIPSLDEQFKARAMQSQIPRSKAFVLPYSAQAQIDLTAQMTSQLPAQTNIQGQVQMQQLDYVQSLKQTTRLDSEYKAQNLPSYAQNRNRTKGKKQAPVEPIKYTTDPVALDDLVKPGRRNKSNEPPIIPSFIPTRKKKSSKKGTNSGSGWKYDRLYNNYGDASKWRGV